MNLAHDSFASPPAVPASRDGRNYRGVLRAIAGSVDENCAAALDYVLIKHGTQDGSSYAPTELSDARELDHDLAPGDTHPCAPKGVSAAEATATLEAIGAADAMRMRRAQLIADGYSAGLTVAPHYVTVTVHRDGRLFAAEREEQQVCNEEGAFRAGCIGACHCGGPGSEDVASFCSISLTLVVRGNGCIAAITSPGAWEGFHVEEILVPEIFMAGSVTSDAYPQLVDARARARYQEQITKVFARFLVLAFTAFDGRLTSYLRMRSAPTLPQQLASVC